MIIQCEYVQRVPAAYVPGQSPTFVTTVISIGLIPTRYEDKEIDGDRIRATDWRGLVIASDLVTDFKVNDVIRVGVKIPAIDMLAGDYRINYDDKVSVGGKTILHQLNLRFLSP